MIVAAATTCISDVPLQEVFDRLADLEYTNIELVIGPNGSLKPEEIRPKLDRLVHLCRTSRRVTPVALFFDLDPSAPVYFEHFSAACQLAKALKVVVMTVRSSVPGTPFNEEVERLRNLVQTATNHGVVVGLLTERGRLTELPDTVGSLCKTVKGLCVTLDPSHYTFQYSKPLDYDAILPNVCHIRLRDTNSLHFQVRIGQGVIEFGRLVIQLTKTGYRRALCVDLAPLEDLDSAAELRKIRLLLESHL